MPIALTAEHRAAGDAVRAWAKRADPIQAVRAGEQDPHAWRTCWAGLADLGLLAAAVPETEGGAGGSLTDLAVLVEQAAVHLAPGPIPGTVLAALLRPEPALLAGKHTVGLSLTGVNAERTDAGLLLTGTVPNVLGAQHGSSVLLPAHTDAGEVWTLLGPDTPGVKIGEARGADLSRPLGEVQLDHCPADVLAVDSERVRDLVAVLFAAEASGVASWCLRTAVAHAKLREQFGRPIGSFQAIKHLCAEMLCRAELATAVAWDAAQTADDPAQRPIAAAVAAAVALDAAVENAKDCIQVLGGIGFTWEHDAHLYLRRALSIRQFMGGSARWRRRVAALTATGSRRTLTVDLGDRVADRARIRAEVERIAALPGAARRTALAETGLLAPHWPAPHGRDADAAEQLLVQQELARAGVSRPDLVIGAWAVPTILKHGSAAQVDRFAAPTLRGELTWCQLFSEPGAGSDLAALRTRAERVDGGWQLTGQKVWTSAARQADWGICLARTNPDVAKQKGISYFLVDMRAPGIDIRPLREITGESLFNEVFLDSVFVPDEMLVGEVDGGWPLARTTLANERVAMGGGSSLGDAVERLLALAAERGAAERGAAERGAAERGAAERGSDDAMTDRLGALVATGLAGSQLELRTTLMRLDGREPGAESSVRKLVGVQHRQDVAEAALELLGADGTAAGPEVQEFLLTRCLSIAGGTTQVLRNVAAERILGLPRG